MLGEYIINNQTVLIYKKLLQKMRKEVKMNIYCFPYAGGSSFIYSELRKKASDKYRIVPMEYPGHGLRMGEELSDSIEYIVDDMFRQIQKKDDGSPFALLGYSMGSKLVYLLYSKYKEHTMFRRLKNIFFCAMSMESQNNKEDYAHISNEKLKEYTLSLGGTKLEDEEDEENFKAFLPIIRNDFILLQHADECIENTNRSEIDVDVCVMYSAEEENVHSYNNYCADVPEYEFFEGGHFFIHSYCDRINECISKHI